MVEQSQNGEWNDERNARRFALIDKKTTGTLTQAEQTELDALTEALRHATDHMIDLDTPRQILGDLLAKVEKH